MEKKVSVIVPIYKVEKYLNECIESILAQTYKNLQIILVDDGSPDQCGKMCDEFAEKDSRIVVVHKANGGLSDARNAGIDVAEGEYILFVDSDDFISQDMIKKMCDSIGKSELCICNLQYIADDGSLMKNSRYNHLAKKMQWNREDFWNHYYSGDAVPCVVAWNKLYKREIFNDIRYDVGKRNEDEYIIDKVINQCKSIVFIPDKCYMYRQRPNSIMSQNFSVKNLDAVEAIILRCERMTEYNYNKAIINKSFFHILRSFGEYYQNIDFSDVDCQNKYYILKKEFTKIYLKELLTFKLNIKLAIKIMIFIANDKLWLRFKK